MYGFDREKWALLAWTQRISAKVQYYLQAGGHHDRYLPENPPLGPQHPQSSREDFLRPDLREFC
jgi:hypothetical protein